jgi:hypothetical protein
MSASIDGHRQRIAGRAPAPFVTPEAVKLYNDFERTLYASL